jgi:hypothetical protein
MAGRDPAISLRLPEITGSRPVMTTVVFGVQTIQV